VIKWLPLTPLAKSVVAFARKEADELSQGYVCTEHILLGLLQVQDGLSAQVLIHLGLTLDGVRAEVLHIYGRQGRREISS
jgi:ATP-dependent Clp protease ATP-binding subunit ClpC